MRQNVKSRHNINIDMAEETYHIAHRFSAIAKKTCKKSQSHNLAVFVGSGSI